MQGWPKRINHKENIVMLPYKSMACPYLENLVHIWSPYLKDRTEIEMVQRRVKKMSRAI